MVRKIQILYACVALAGAIIGGAPVFGAAEDVPVVGALDDPPIAASGGKADEGAPAEESDLIVEGEQVSLLVEASTAFSEGKIDDSRKLLQEAVAKSPSLPPADLILAEFHLDAGQRSAARGLLEAAAAKDATHPQLYLSFGKLALAENRLTEAQMHFEKMEQLGPRKEWGGAEVAGFRAAILSGKAVVAERRGDWEVAQRLLAELVPLLPSQILLRQRWGKALLLTGNESGAHEQFTVAFGADPTVGHPNAAIGAILVQTGQYDRANEHFSGALTQSPNDGPIHYAWSVALLYQDRLQEADTHARRAADTGLDTSKLLRHRGQLSWSLGRFEESERYFQKLLKRAPDDSLAKYYLVLAMASQRSKSKRNEALAFAQEFAGKEPRSLSATAALGTAYFALGELENAEGALAPIAGHPELPPETLLLYGRALSHNGKTEEARKVAGRLNDRLNQPGVFLTRAAATEWSQAMLLDE